MKEFLFKIYMLAFMALVVFFIVTIWNVTFGHIVHEYHERQEAKEIMALKEAKQIETEKNTFEKTDRRFIPHRHLNICCASRGLAGICGL